MILPTIPIISKGLNIMKLTDIVIPINLFDIAVFFHHPCCGISKLFLCEPQLV